MIADHAHIATPAAIAFTMHLYSFSLTSSCRIYSYHLPACPQTKSQPNHLYLHHTQQEVDAHKRLVLVDWLIEVVDEFVLSQESLYLAISLLDRFLSMQAVPRCQLQLLGVTCLWVASKYEEVLPPALQVCSTGRTGSSSGRNQGGGSSRNGNNSKQQCSSSARAYATSI